MVNVKGQVEALIASEPVKPNRCAQRFGRY